MRYAKGTLNYGLFYEYGAEIEVFGYTDADWARSAYDRRSTSGYVFSIGSAAVSWSSKKQPTVALSSTEAEYRGAALAACEIAWLRKLLSDLGHNVQEPVTLYCDNMSSIQLAKTIQCFMQGQNTLRFIIITYGRRFLLERLIWCM